MTAPAETGVNEDLLRRVLEHVTAHPDEHNQAHWAVRSDCGTAYCVAGHAVVMSGYAPDWSAAFGATATVAGVSTTGVVGTDQTIGEVAADLLRLDVDGEGDHRLFHGSNDLADLWRIAAELTDGRVSRPTTAQK